MLTAIRKLYQGSASYDDMQVYAEKAVYDDPFSYCDTRYKVAGQWYGQCATYQTPEPESWARGLNPKDLRESLADMRSSTKEYPKSPPPPLSTRSKWS